MVDHYQFNALKEVALEILDKYQGARLDWLEEWSYNIEVDTFAVETEVDEYRERIYRIMGFPTE